MAFFGAVDQGHMPHNILYRPKYPPNISDPFKNEAALLNGLITKSRLKAEQNKRRSWLADFYGEQLLRCLVSDKREPVFTPSDLHRGNVLVEIPRAGTSKELTVRLVDWGSAGWYPAY
ncbi:hypothetical protein LZ554_005132 [Drepanopeziza brunnea f. sp. 'monogermtubi']|nr:hypothetical protein LZ554_005132 [Drepanopeziza brunnea f. sp. 'monogermtubi']